MLWALLSEQMFLNSAWILSRTKEDPVKNTFS